MNKKISLNLNLLLIEKPNLSVVCNPPLPLPLPSYGGYETETRLNAGDLPYIGPQPHLDCIVLGSTEFFLTLFFLIFPNPFPFPILKMWEPCWEDERLRESWVRYSQSWWLSLTPEGWSFYFPTYFRLTMGSDNDFVSLLGALGLAPFSNSTSKRHPSLNPICTIVYISYILLPYYNSLPSSSQHSTTSPHHSLFLPSSPFYNPHLYNLWKLFSPSGMDWHFVVPILWQCPTFPTMPLKASRQSLSSQFVHALSQFHLESLSTCNTYPGWPHW